MGHSSSIAFGIASQQPNRNVYCFDGKYQFYFLGDGALLMHGGSMAIIGTSKAKNFKHIIFNNEAHDSVGAQPCLGGSVLFIIIFIKIDICSWAKSMKYKDAF